MKLYGSNARVARSHMKAAHRMHPLEGLVLRTVYRPRPPTLTAKLVDWFGDLVRRLRPTERLSAPAPYVRAGRWAHAEKAS